MTRPYLTSRSYFHSVYIRGKKTLPLRQRAQYLRAAALLSLSLRQTTLRLAPAFSEFQSHSAFPRRWTLLLKVSRYRNVILWFCNDTVDYFLRIVTPGPLILSLPIA